MCEIDEDEYVWDCAPWEDQRYLEFVMGISAFEVASDFFLPVDCGPHGGKFFQCGDYWEDDLQGLLGSRVAEEEVNMEDFVVWELECGFDYPDYLGDVWCSGDALRDLDESLEVLKEVLGRQPVDIRATYDLGTTVTEVLPWEERGGNDAEKTWDWEEVERAARGERDSVARQPQCEGELLGRSNLRHKLLVNMGWSQDVGRGGSGRSSVGTAGESYEGGCESW